MTAPLPALARWLPAETPAIAAAAVRRALTDVGICEIPPGSNRSGVIDAYVRATGSPVASFWCAAACAAWWRDVGLPIPPTAAASCNAWQSWAKKTGRWSVVPVAGAVVLYGFGSNAEHCGLVVRTDPIVLTVEGNTSLAGYSRNGVAVDLKAIYAERVMGYVLPVPDAVAA
jgi:hypothetical protein